MRWFILLAFIGVLLVKNATPSKNLGYPSRLDWLFGVNNEPDENKEENKEKEQKDDKPTVCQSQECKKIARIISESMDKSADPCDDFYEYACGKWPEHNPIPNGLEFWSMFERAQINAQGQIKKILDEGPKKSDLLAVNLAKKWYAVCMNTDAMERYGLEPLVFTLSRIGGWPLIMEQDEWNEQEYSWQKVDDQYVRLTGKNAFHDVSVKIDYGSNETRKVVYIDVPDLPPGSYRLWSKTYSKEEVDKSDEDASNEQKDSQERGSKEKNDDKSDNNRNDENDNDNNDNNESDREKLRVWKTEKNHVKQERKKRPKETLEVTTPQDNTKEMIDEDNDLKKYANYISKVARAIAKARGVEVSEEHMDKDIQDMIKFQTKLVKIPVGMRYSDVESMTLNDFQKWYDKKKPKTPNSAINWAYKIGELFDEAHVQIGDDLTVEISQQNYFKDLVALLDTTSSRTIVNYIHWNFLSRIIKTTTSEMRKLYYAWEGREENDDKEVLGISLRSRKCTREVAEMSVILAYEYVRNHFSDEITKTASDMVDDVQKEVEYQIKESNWMDEDTKDFVLAKLVNLDKFIGYPDWFKNNTKVKQYFQGLRTTLLHTTTVGVREREGRIPHAGVDRAR